MFNAGSQFGLGIAVGFLVVEVAQYLAQMCYSRYLGNRIKKTNQKDIQR